jgi:hypothetical protein
MTKYLKAICLLFFLSFLFICFVGTATLKAEGCSGNYPILKDDFFRHVSIISRLMNESASENKLAEYMRDNNIDEQNLMLSMTKFKVNLEDAMDPEKRILETEYADCVAEIRFNQNEFKLLGQYFPDLASRIMEKRVTQ